MTVETVNFISDLDQNNPAGGDSIAEGDDHIRNIKKAIKSTFPNVTKAVTATADEINKISDFVAGGNGIFASCKHNGTSTMYGHNVSSVQFVGSGITRVNFSQPTDGFDHHYAVLITPAAVGGKNVSVSIVDQRDSYVDFKTVELDGSWNSVTSTPGFSMIMVDMIQTEANANT